MTSPVKLPPLPCEVGLVRALFRGQADYFTAQDSYYTQDQMRAYAEEAVRQALAELVPVGCCMATADGHLHMFSSMRAADEVGQRARNLRQKMILLYVLPETRDG